MLIAGATPETRAFLRDELRRVGIKDLHEVSSLGHLPAAVVSRNPSAALVVVDSLDHAGHVLALLASCGAADLDVFFCAPCSREEADAFVDRVGVGVVRSPIDLDRLAILFETYRDTFSAGPSNLDRDVA